MCCYQTHCMFDSFLLIISFTDVSDWRLLQSLRSCVSEVIQAIDDQMSKQEDLQKKKVCQTSSFTLIPFFYSLVMYYNPDYNCFITIQVIQLLMLKISNKDNSSFGESVIMFFLYYAVHQVCVSRLIQVVRSVEKIEKILHSQNSKESSSREINRWETFLLTKPLASCCQ